MTQTCQNCDTLVPGSHCQRERVRMVTLEKSRSKGVVRKSQTLVNEQRAEALQPFPAASLPQQGAELMLSHHHT